MMKWWCCVLAFSAGLAVFGQARADLVAIQNPGFEDTAGQNVVGAFTFGTPTGWSIYDPEGVTPSSGVYIGTLEPNGTDFFNDFAPEGDRVAILFNSSREGDGEYGYEQTLSGVLQANMQYTLTVEVGNIASGVSSNGTFFNLDEFPGYRVELLAGGTVVAQDLNSLSIPEAEFATSTVSFLADEGHALLGQALGIRLVSLNEIPSGYTEATSPDLEVDFDHVQLDATAVPEPSGLAVLMILGVHGLVVRKRIR